jgi:multiple sugar transport system substrate-binding protein
MKTPKLRRHRPATPTAVSARSPRRARQVRRFGALAVLVAFTASLTAACGGSSSGTRSTLTIANDKGAWKSFFEQIGGVSKQDIGLGLTPDGYTDEPTYQAHIKTSLMTNSKPDLFTWATGPLLAQLAGGGQVANTSDIWQKAVADGDLPQSLEQYYTVNGQQYCVPLNISYWVMFYNKHLFDSAGITSTPTTWAELMRDAATLKAHGDTAFYQTNVLFSFVWFQQLIAGQDPDFYDRLVSGKASFTDPVVVRAMQLWQGMIKDGYMSDPGDKTDPATMLKSGKVAMIPFGTWFNTSMTQDGMKPGVDYGMFVIPTVTPNLSKTPVAVESGALCAPAKAYDQAADSKFLNWWVTTDAQKPWADSRGDVSANPKVAIQDPGLQQITKQANDPRYELVNRYFDAVSPAVLTATLDALGAFMQNPGSYLHQLRTIQQAAGSGSGG